MSFKYFKPKHLLLCVSLSALLVSPVSYAQRFVQDENLNQGGTTLTEKEKQERKLKNVAAINGVLVGYGLSCEIPKEQVERLHNRFMYLVHALKDKSNQDLMQTEYEDQLGIAKEKGPSYSQTDCNYIKEEYNKIISEMDKEAELAKSSRKE